MSDYEKSESPYEQGRAAWFAGKDVSANPYPKDTQLQSRLEWNVGWDQIRLESEYAGWEDE